MSERDCKNQTKVEFIKYRGRIHVFFRCDRLTTCRAIYKWLLADYVKIASLSPDDQLYDEGDLSRSYEKIRVVDYHQQVDIGGVKFTPYPAGHVLGACMFLIEIAGVRLLYTGDYSREEDRHLMAAERPPNIVPEVLIC